MAKESDPERDLPKPIAELDLEKVLEKASKYYDWSPDQEKEADLWYRRFLTLCLEHRGPVAAIGADADDLWHAHLQDTRKYREDCEAVFGRFLDHTPIYGEPTAAELEHVEETKELYRRRFGAEPPKVAWVCFYHWPPF